MELKQAENKVVIEGILSEIDLKYGSFQKKKKEDMDLNSIEQKNGSPMKSVGGSIKIKVEQEINKVPTTLEVPVFMFAPQYTNNGAKNPAFESIEKVMNEYKSIAAVGEELADRIRITSGSINMNEYWATPDKFVSYPRIRASFVQKIKKEEMNSRATFSVQFMVHTNAEELDRDGVATGRQLIKGILPQYGGKVDIVDFYAISPSVIEGVKSYWQKGDTVKAIGKLNFSSRTETALEEVDFGEPIERTKTINVSELIITGGGQTPLEGDFAFDRDAVREAIVARQADLESRKAKDISRTKRAAAPAQDINDLGF